MIIWRGKGRRSPSLRAFWRSRKSPRIDKARPPTRYCGYQFLETPYIVHFAHFWVTRIYYYIVKQDPSNVQYRSTDFLLIFCEKNQALYISPCSTAPIPVSPKLTEWRCSNRLILNNPFGVTFAQGIFKICRVEIPLIMILILQHQMFWLVSPSKA